MRSIRLPRHRRPPFAARRPTPKRSDAAQDAGTRPEGYPVRPTLSGSVTDANDNAKGQQPRDVAQLWSPAEQYVRRTAMLRYCTARAQQTFQHTDADSACGSGRHCRACGPRAGAPTSRAGSGAVGGARGARVATRGGLRIAPRWSFAVWVGRSHGGGHYLFFARGLDRRCSSSTPTRGCSRPSFLARTG